MIHIDADTPRAFAMSQDFAAISSAILAALLILTLTELQATSTQLHEWRTALLSEYSRELQASFDEYWSGSALTDSEKRRIARNLNRYRVRQTWMIWDGAWRSMYRLAATGCLVGLAVVVRWSALAKHPRGYTSALYILIVIGFAALALLYGFVARGMMQQAVQRHEYLIKWAKVLDVPDLKHMQSLRDPWLKAESLEPVGWSMTRPWKAWRLSQQNRANPMR
ncbi:hypothetical protein AB0F46_24345 [Streptomyces sp. NPDC026665]|uniref:hypothetical protein n=1 Tax=Streptomyces sp. NPDC026665 TaxID=3154798 RepID=UPI0033D61C58